MLGNENEKQDIKFWQIKSLLKQLINLKNRILLKFYFNYF
jgi:hypothetical protein